jgi:hypothetical protein
MSELQQACIRCRSYSSPQRQHDFVLVKGQLATPLCALSQRLETKPREAIMSLEYDVGNEKLWAAVIQQALDDATSQYLEPRIINEAREWFTIPNRNFVEVCEYAGMDFAKVRIAASKIIARHDAFPVSINAKQPKYYEHESQNLTLRQWAEFKGMPARLLSNRLKNGWSFERTITTPCYVKSTLPYSGKLQQGWAKTYECEGRTLSLNEWSAIKSVSYFVLYKRLHSGWTIERALNTPLLPRNRKRPRPSKKSIHTAPNTKAGVGQNLQENVWDRRGCNAQDFSETGFSKIKELTE